MCEFFIVRIPTDYLGKVSPAIGVVGLDDQLSWTFMFADVNYRWPRCLPDKYWHVVEKLTEKLSAKSNRKTKLSSSQWKTVLNRLISKEMKVSGPFQCHQDDVHQCVNDCYQRYVYGQTGA